MEDFAVPKYNWDIEAVSDWGKRIAAYTPQQRKFYNEMVPRMAELKNIMNSKDGWSLLVDSKEEQVLIETKKSVRGLTICRG